MKTLIFVTQNKNKLEIANKLLPDFDIQNVDFEVPEIQSLDPKEIISYKLKYAYEKLQKPCYVIDDSLFFDCLNNFPGPFIKWYYDKTVGAEKTCKIANLFNEYGCRWVSILGYYDGKECHYFEEIVEGEIPTEPRGNNGFSWDPIFIPKGEKETFAEMSFEKKHTFTTSSKLYNRFREFLKSQKL